MILSALLSSVMCIVSFHNIHISYGTSDLSKGKFSGTLSYYKDDFLKAVSTWYKRDAASMTTEQRTAAMNNYVRNYFRIWESGTKIEMNSLEAKEDETTIVYTFSFPVSLASKELTIDHRAIFDVYSDQINIMSFSAFGKDYNYIFKPSAPTYLLKK